jgi:hypothetical protein
MKREGDFPLVDASANGLGVRPNDDIPVDQSGNVQSNTGGMSVVPDGRSLPAHRIPKRLKSKFPRATGINALFCWRLGDGPFVDSVVNETLVLKLDRADHGTVQPSLRCALSEFQQSLAETREQWILIDWEDVFPT